MNHEALSKIFQRVLMAAVAASGAALAQGCARTVVPEDAGPSDGTSPPDARVDAGSCTPMVVRSATCEATVRFPCNPPPGIVIGGSISSATCMAACPPMTPGSPFLCTAAAGDAGAVDLYCTYCAVGRRTEGLATPAVRAGDCAIGGYLANHAMLEAASVEAFERLCEELRSFGAPEALLAKVTRAADDERDHARRVALEAQRFGVTPPAPVVAPVRARTLLEVAKENVVEGCVRETFGALFASWQAAHTQDPALAGMYAQLAADETHHGALSLALATWFNTRLNEAERRDVRDAMTGAVAELRREVRVGNAAQLAGPLGMPSAEESLRLFDGLAAEIWN